MVAHVVTVPVWLSLANHAFAADDRVIGEMLAAVLDLIIPQDETPSASALDVHLSLLALSKTIPSYPDLILQGLGWMEQNARQAGFAGFLAMPPAEQETLMTAAFAAPAQSLPQVFAQRLRDDAMTIYYRDPRALVGLGIDGPIQPAGYPDHDKAPS